MESIEHGNTSPVRRIVIIGLALLACVLLWQIRPTDVQSHYGFFALVPAFITILVCFTTKHVLVALLLGIASGGLIIGDLNIINEFLVPSLGSEKYGQILLIYMWTLGGILGLWNRNGGARYFAEAAARRFIRSRVTAKLFAWMMGVVFHQGGTISTVLTGTTVRPVSDQHKVAREELSYVVDSTASPIATIIPFNGWPIYIAGLLVVVPELSHLITSSDDAIGLFYKAIPYNFYAIIAVAMTFLFSMDRLPLFRTPMEKAVNRVNTTGQLVAPGDDPMTSEELAEPKVLEGYQPSLVDFLAPMGVLLSFCIVPLLFGGSPLVFEGFGVALVTGLVISVLKGMSLHQAFDAALTGVKGITLAAIVLGLAITLGTVSAKLGASTYVIEVVAPWLQSAPFVLPSLLMAICMIISFSIGTSFGTYAVVFPVGLPLAVALAPGNETFVLLTFAAILGGSVFGDQCSPISDTTILSSMATGSDLMAHVNTQFPLAFFAAFVSSVLYFILSYALF